MLLGQEERDLKRRERETAGGRRGGKSKTNACEGWAPAGGGQRDNPGGERGTRRGGRIEGGLGEKTERGEAMGACGVS